MNRVGSFLIVTLFAPALWGDTREQPVGLILNAGSAKLVRANTETEVAARSGDVLFTGDTIRSKAGPATFLYCPGKTMQTLTPDGEVALDQKQLKVKIGKLADQKPAPCFLPQVVRVAVASQQHYGISMTRGLGDGPAPLPPEKFPSEVVAELAPFDETLAKDSKLGHQ